MVRLLPASSADRFDFFGNLVFQYLYAKSAILAPCKILVARAGRHSGTKVGQPALQMADSQTSAQVDSS